MTQKSPGSISEPTLPCKTCGEPTPAIALPGDGRTVMVPTICRPCQALAFQGPPPVEHEGIESVDKICEECGNEFETTVAWILGRKIDLVRFCQACTKGHEESAVSAAQAAFLAKRRAEWEETCPPYYRTPEIVEALPKDRVAAVSAALTLGPGVCIVGPSGNFKTTAMFHGAIKKLIWRRKRVAYCLASQWKAECSAAAKETTIKSFLRPFIEADYLFIDDFGNMAGTPASEEALHHLLERRMNHQRPLLITTQYTGRTLSATFKRIELADAIMRRMHTLTGPPIKFL